MLEMNLPALGKGKEGKGYNCYDVSTYYNPSLQSHMYICKDTYKS
jgi:hypothetical protein